MPIVRSDAPEHRVMRAGSLCERRNSDSFRWGAGRRASADHLPDDLGSIQQGLRRQVGVALGHADLGMAQQPLNDVERDTLINEEARERVAQVMEPDIAQSSTAPDAIPRIEQRRERMAAERRGEDVLAALVARDRLQQRNRCAIERDGSGLAGFRQGHQQRAPLPVHILPLGVGNLVVL